MGFIGVILAALVCYGFGAVYYMALKNPWIEASGVQPDRMDKNDKTPFIITGIACLIAAGMLRHVLVMSGIEGLIASAVTGGSIGLFFAGAWIFINNAFEGKSTKLSVINTGYAAIGLALAGAVLSFF